MTVTAGGPSALSEDMPEVDGRARISRAVDWRPAGLSSRISAEVVAGLVNDGSAPEVAAEAVREAAQRGAAIRFIQVLPVTMADPVGADADAATFQAAMRALRGHSRTRCTFEVATGDPQQVLVERSRTASMLVVGEDRPTSEASVAEFCQRYAACPVRTVARRTTPFGR